MISLILVSVFIIAMIAAGVWGMKKTKTLNDFFIGSRKIGPWISALSYGTAYFSAVIFIGFAGKLGWGYGLNVLWIAIGNAVIGSFLAWIVLGRRTRTMTQNLDVVTMPEFLQERFSGKYFKIIAASVIFLFLLPYAASVFKGLGYLFEVNFNISFDTALLIMVAITAVYLILGGYFAVTITDFIQGFVMLFGAILMVVILVGQAGGLTSSIHQISENYYRDVFSQGAPDYIMLAALIFMTSFGVWGMPQMVQKFYAVKNEKVIKLAAYTTLIFALTISVCAYFTGALTHVFFNAPILGANGAANFDAMIPELLIRFLPEGVMALILLLILSASMSTLSALVLVSASSIAIDLYKGHVNPKVSKASSVFMMRFLTGIFLLISFLIAKYEFSFIITLMSLSWGVIAGGFLAPYVYGLYWKGATRAGAKSAMISGIFLAISLFYILGANNAPLASSIAMIVPFAVVPAVSIFTKKPDAKKIKKAFKGI
ncbi:sodium:solute symporter family transporter [Endomicrobium proavitum]|uniref:SSS sodium solute transporter superfamily n=1 Tax=Endomicrobium proavitum TaxID=1408281 RepID=A0A0G3WGE3_9BACT|nr:sodium transporter [Endomicrobium proavitum]AKL97433.1 SSS sodium solute transporter superfamily [Endomicrobium proavitum]